MTPDEAIQTAEALTAFATRKLGTIEVKFGEGEWAPCTPEFIRELRVRYRFTSWPTREQRRLASNAKLYGEWLVQRFRIQCRCVVIDQWGPWSDTGNWPGYDSPGFEYRRKPEPKVVPWTFESHPKEAVWVKLKTGEDEGLITGWVKYGCYLATGYYSYDSLFSIFVQRDGSPCGTTEGAPNE